MVESSGAGTPGERKCGVWDFSSRVEGLSTAAVLIVVGIGNGEIVGVGAPHRCFPAGGGGGR